MAELHDDKPGFAWPADLDSPERYPRHWTALRRESLWHLDRCAYAAQNGRKDIALAELQLGTPSLRRKDSGDAGPVVIVEPPTTIIGSGVRTFDTGQSAPSGPSRRMDTANGREV